MSSPVRIQLSRKKGWRMPENTVKVDRSSKWGNPFIVSKHGTAAECVHLFEVICTQAYVASVDQECFTAQKDFVQHAIEHWDELRGKNLACWCKLGAPCHADVLLKLVNGGSES